MEWCPECGGDLEEFEDSFQCIDCNQSFTADSTNDEYDYLDPDPIY